MEENLRNLRNRRNLRFRPYRLDTAKIERAYFGTVLCHNRLDSALLDTLQSPTINGGLWVGTNAGC